jgi:hypothetical protein
MSRYLFVLSVKSLAKIVVASAIALIPIGSFLISIKSVQAATQTICGFNVPAGYVPVGYTRSNSCNLSFANNNATVIDTPRAGLTICVYKDPIPSGYVAVGYTRSNSCNLSFANSNASIINVPKSGLTICGFTAPSGFTVAGQTRSNACDLSFANNNAVILR